MAAAPIVFRTTHRIRFSDLDPYNHMSTARYASYFVDHRMDGLRDMNEREGITVISNLHTLDTARTYCQRIIGMAAGKVVFDGKPEDLTRDAVSAMLKSFAPKDRAEMVKDDKVVVTCEFCSSVYQFTPHEAGVEE